MRQSGRHFLQILGPSAVPDRILRAIAMSVVDHRGPGFADLGNRVLSGIRSIFKTRQPVIIYSTSGTGAWEVALVNTLSAGDKVLMGTLGGIEMGLQLANVPHQGGGTQAALEYLKSPR